MNISPTIQNALGKVALELRKNAPAILTAVGVVSVVSAGVLAAKNTLKLEERIDEGKDRLDWTNDQIKEGDAPESARTKAYVRNVVEVGKLYIMPATLMVGGIACILSAQNILNKRNAALVSAYNGLAASYKAYRGRVAEELGEEKERDLYLGQRDEEYTDENGKKQKKKVLVDGEHVGHPYRFVYGPDNDNWTGFHDENLFRLQVAQNMYNDLLKAKGHVFLRDVLNTLGIQDTPASAVTGWIYDPDNPEHTGDNFIEFNVRDFQSEYGYILLDFNVDGEIWYKI
ncbi:hypothetical protein PBI_CAMILLE_44 [Microbacterium phage Camille]|nr:hypothetical protein PBI_CAMILLE_44 [Microbacterium phage Camille]